MGKFKDLATLLTESLLVDNLPTDFLAKEPIIAASPDRLALREPPISEITPQLIPLDQIRRSPFQPRQFFNSEKIAKMADSFRQYQLKGTYPKTAILLRPLSDGYELIFGEQRKIAAEQAGFVEFLAFVDATITDDEAMELALTENLMREDLNPLEKTDAILKLAAVRLQTTPEDIKRLLDKAANRRKQATDNVTRTEQWQTLETFFQELPDQISPESFRTNYLPLLNLPEDVLDALRQGKLEYTKARAISKVKNSDQRQQLLKEAITQKLSLQKIRDRIRSLSSSNGIRSDFQPIPDRLITLTQHIQQTKAWEDPKKAQQIQVLLDKLERLL